MDKNNKVVLICPKFNGYEHLLIGNLKNIFDHVIFIQEKQVGFFWDLLYKLFPKINAKFQRMILMNKINRLGFNINKCLIIRGEYFDERIISNLKSRCENIICYQWDSFANNKAAFGFIYNDIPVYTFDYRDSQDYSISYIPLFHCDYLKYEDNNVYDLSFVGVYTPDRFDIFNDIIVWVDKNKLNGFFYMKISIASIPKLLIRMIKRRYSVSTLKYLRLNSLDLSKSHNIMKKTNVVIDICHKSQSGLTMRFMEAIGLNKRIITNNMYANNEGEYDLDSIVITDEFSFSDFNKLRSIKYTSHSSAESLHVSRWIERVIRHEV